MILDIEWLLERLGQAGITAILKVDSERMAESGDAWTISMGGPGLGKGEYIRVDATTLKECLEKGFARLREYPGDWYWLPSTD